MLLAGCPWGPAHKAPTDRAGHARVSRLFAPRAHTEVVRYLRPRRDDRFVLAYAVAMFAVAEFVVHERIRRRPASRGGVASGPGYGGSPPP
jgi:hypothetical protein